MQRAAGLFPGWRAKIPRASWSKNQIIRQKQCCNKLNKDLKNDPCEKTLDEKFLIFCAIHNVPAIDNTFEV